MLLLYSCLSQTSWGLCSVNLINLFFSLFFFFDAPIFFSFFFFVSMMRSKASDEMLKWTSCCMSYEACLHPSFAAAFASTHHIWAPQQTGLTNKKKWQQNGVKSWPLNICFVWFSTTEKSSKASKGDMKFPSHFPPVFKAKLLNSVVELHQCHGSTLQSN